MIYFQSQVDKLMQEKDKAITRLEQEVGNLQKRLAQETQRANAAVDQLLLDARHKPVTLNVTDVHDPVEQEFKKQLKSALSELAFVGADYDSEKEEKRASGQ